MTTVSAAPVASITVNLAKPGPGGSTRRCRRPSISPTDTPFTSMVIGSRPPATFPGIGECPGTGEGIEQDWRRGGAADQTRHRRTVGTSNPDPDGDAAIEADRPGIAVAVAGAGLERDPVMRSVLRWRRADQHVADLPGRHLIHQPQGIARLVFRDLAHQP